MAEPNIQEGILISVDVHGDRYALFADKLLGQRQVVVKALGSVVGEIGGVSGGAILGDGNVGLILDGKGILDLFHEQALPWGDQQMETAHV